RVLPFAQGEVVWRRCGEGKPGQGFGVKFTGFLHPRAHDMVGYLVKAIENGEPLHVDGTKPHSWRGVGFASAAALIAGAMGTGIFLAVFGGSPEVADEEETTVAAPAPTATPLAASPGTLSPSKGEGAATPEVITAPTLIPETPEVKKIEIAPM